MDTDLDAPTIERQVCEAVGWRVNLAGNGRGRAPSTELIFAGEPCD
jgi:hypothetical protein